MADKVRMVSLVLFTLTVMASIIGWFTGLDPRDLTTVLGTLAVAIGIGEASNIGKRVTFSSAAAEFYKDNE